MDREASWDKYTVYFNSGTQVSFEGGSGDCSEIIMKNGNRSGFRRQARVCAAMWLSVPEFADRALSDDRGRLSMGLSDKTFLEFDKNGNFVKATK